MPKVKASQSKTLQHLLRSHELTRTQRTTPRGVQVPPDLSVMWPPSSWSSLGFHCGIIRQQSSHFMLRSPEAQCREQVPRQPEEGEFRGEERVVTAQWLRVRPKQREEGRRERAAYCTHLSLSRSFSDLVLYIQGAELKMAAPP